LSVGVSVDSAESRVGSAVSMVGSTVAAVGSAMGAVVVFSVGRGVGTTGTGTEVPIEG
jgi:hypothetical protein